MQNAGTTGIKNTTRQEVPAGGKNELHISVWRKEKLLLSLLIRFRLKLLVLDNEALVAASADLSFGIVSGNIKYEAASVYLDKFSLAPYGHSKRCRCVVCYV